MGTFVSLFLGLFWSLAGSAPVLPTPQAPAAVKSTQRALLDQYCVTCHNDRLKTAGITLDKMDVDHVATDAATWERVVQQLRARAMPPVGRPRPDKSAYDAFRIWLENELDKAGAADLNAGTTVSFHRLNRAEYQNAIRDLLGIDVDATRFLPEDPKSNGFDNMGGAIKMSPDLLETYMKAAMKISREAIGVSVTPQQTTYKLEDDQSQDDRSQDLPFGTRGGTEAKHYFPVDGEYLVTVRLVRLGTAAIAGLNDEHQIDFRVDGERVDLTTIGRKGMVTANGGTGAGSGTTDPDVAGAKADFQYRLPLKAGSHTLTATFFKKPNLQVDGTRVILDRPAYEAGRTHGLPYISSITVLGPQKVSGSGNSPSRKRVFVCQPTSGASASRTGRSNQQNGPAQEAVCARQIITTLARRAYRGVLKDADIQTLMTFYTSGRSEGSFEEGIQSALERILVSPKFLYRIEIPPAVPTDGNYRISDLELASRLSFFLWSSIPDDQLLTLAANGRLKEPAILEQQVKRMLADPRARALTDNFADQWLQLTDIENVNHDPIMFPEADKTLRQSLREETELLFDSIRIENRSLVDLLTANYTFVNEPIAKLYDIPNIYGPRMRRIVLPADSPRVGILGHGSILMLTSHANTTSPVLRGKWILDNILGTPPPPPPPVVPDLNPIGADGKILSIREQMIAHRANPVCASCHARMEPLGLAMENFDATGRWRTLNENGEPVDASSEMIDGTLFEGPAGLRNILVSNSEQFVLTGTNRLLTYALGRGLEYYDMPTVRKIVREAAPAKYSFSSLVLGVVKSIPFQMRRVPKSDS
jgi:mono/diheme cytochrome c family protein